MRAKAKSGAFGFLDKKAWGKFVIFLHGSYFGKTSKEVDGYTREALPNKAFMPACSQQVEIAVSRVEVKALGYKSYQDKRHQRLRT